MTLFFSALAAYLVGSIPTGLILARIFGGVDIRESGSGNIGATNVYRTLGKKVGVMTLAGDCLKGYLPVIAVIYAGFPESHVMIVALAAFLGHVFTIFLKFKGGKGVATGLGVFLAVFPKAVLAALILFILMVFVTRYVSLASISAAALVPAVTVLTGSSSEKVALSVTVSLIVIVKHHENIRRLISGTENKFKA